MSSPLQKEFDYYLRHQNEIVKEHNGKFVVIKDCAVIGAYDDEIKAIDTTKQEHEIGTFLVQYVSAGDTAYTQSFHSRATFS